ncbi:hypothetical protein LC724_16495 [Blautia sp. RD014234]|nr:hypothetical protein [Blautia parvula]
MHELEVVKIRLVKGTSLYSDKELNSLRLSWSRSPGRWPYMTGKSCAS